MRYGKVIILMIDDLTFNILKYNYCLNTVGKKFETETEIDRFFFMIELRTLKCCLTCGTSLRTQNNLIHRSRHHNHVGKTIINHPFGNGFCKTYLW